MKIYMSNPVILLGARGKKSMVVVLQDSGGQRLELVFTSGSIASQFVAHASPAVETLLKGKQGTTWPPSTTTNTESHLRAAGLLEAPLMDVREFLGVRPRSTSGGPRGKTTPKP